MTIAFADIVDHVCARREITRAEFMSAAKLFHLAQARHEACYLARDLTTMSTGAIGRLMKRDYSNVCYGERRVATRMRENPEYAREIAELRTAILQAADRPPVEVANPNQLASIARRIIGERHPAPHATGSELRALASAYLGAVETPKETAGADR